MRKYTLRAGLISTAAAFVIFGNAAVFALPGATPMHAIYPGSGSPTPTTDPNPSSSTSDGSGDTASTPLPPTRPHPLTAPQQQTCQNRAAAINNILSRIDTRTQKQITLFGTIATRVETFYTTKSKPVSNYDQLVAAITAAKTQAQTDLSSMHANSTINCSGTDPKGAVTAFQTDLKTEITDLHNYRTAVKNLITAIATANGVTVSSSTQTTTTGGQQ